MNTGFGGRLYIDQKFNLISMYGEEIDKDMIVLMNDLREEVERINEKWNFSIYIIEL